MPVYEVEGTKSVGHVDHLIPDVAIEFASGALVSREAVETEIDIMLEHVREFWSKEPDEVMRLIAAMSARCTEMCIHLHRLEGQRQWKQVRTMQVERLLAELDRQFRLHSRMVELRRQDIELLR